jgi:hypothetical protein
MQNYKKNYKNIEENKSESTRVNSTNLLYTKWDWNKKNSFLKEWTSKKKSKLNKKYYKIKCKLQVSLTNPLSK